MNVRSLCAFTLPETQRRSDGGCYSLGATAGQPDPALWVGHGYTLAGGFRPGPVHFRIYVPLVQRSP